MSVRPAKIKDAHQIAEAHIASWQSAYRGIIPSSILENLSIENRADFWAKAIKESKSKILVYEHNQNVVGFISFGPNRDEDVDKANVAEIYAIYLAPDAYRKGFGSKLLQSALTALRRQAYQTITLWVLTQNTVGRKFYEAIGFSINGKEKIDTLRDGTKLYEIQYQFVL